MANPSRIQAAVANPLTVHAHSGDEAVEEMENEPPSPTTLPSQKEKPHLKKGMTHEELHSIYAGADGVMDEIGEIMMKYDADQSGSFSVAEVKAIIHDLENHRKQGHRVTDCFITMSSLLNAFGDLDLMTLLHIMAQTMMIQQLARASDHRKQAKHIFRALMLTIVVGLIVLGTVFAMMFLSQEAAKESHTSGGAMVDLDGQIVKMGKVESMSGVFDVARIDTNTLAYMESLTFFIDMRSDANVNSEVEVTMQVGGAMRAPDDSNKVYVITTSGFRITIDAESETGTIKMKSATFPISDKSFSRSLHDDSTQEEPWFNCDKSSATCAPKNPPND